MMNKDRKPRLALIDDNPDFIRSLQANIGKFFDAKLLVMTAKLDATSLISEIEQFKPEHLIIDVNLGQAAASKTLLRALQNILPPHCRIWLISQAGREHVDETIAAYQEIDGRVENRVLQKPVSAKRLYAELTDSSVFEPQGVMKNLPLPVRVLTTSGKIAFVNSEWKDTDYPSPDLFISDQKFLTGTREFVGSFRGGEGEKKYAGFTVYSWLEDQYDQHFLIQVATSHPIPDISLSVDEIVEQVFRAMAMAGYSRGRFYRVRPLALCEKRSPNDCDQRLELEKVFPEKPLDPVVLPLRGELRKRYYAYKKPKKSNELIYTLRDADKDVASKDPDIQYLNDLLDIGDIPNWLEIPVWLDSETAPKSDHCSQPTQEMVGWLLFDRAPLPGKASVDPRIDEPSVHRVEPLLLNLVYLLQRALRQERLEELWDYEKYMRGLDADLTDSIHLEGRFQRVLEALVHMSESQSGVLVLEDEDHDHYLKIQATFGEGPPACLRDIVIPKDLKVHPIVEAWDTGTPRIIQDFSQSDEQKSLIALLQSDEASHIPSQCHEPFISWVNHIGCLLALPIALPDSDTPKTIGAITLQYDSAYALTRCKWERIFAVLQRARWVVQQAVAQRERKIHDRSISHELQENLASALKSIEAIAQREKPDENLVCARLHLTDAQDLVKNLDKQHPETEKDAVFQPGNLIRDYLNLLTQCGAGIQSPRLKGYSLTPTHWQDQYWQVQLVGNDESFGRIVRVLLHNAAKFSSNKDARIMLTASISKNIWRLEIRNPGQLEAPENARKHGNRIGLKTAKMLARISNAELTIENSDRNEVTATLQWPLAKEEPSYA